LRATRRYLAGPLYKPTPVAYDATCTPLAYKNRKMEFIEAPAFTRFLPEYMDDDVYREFQTQLAGNPEGGDVMPGTGGFRKVRWADPRRGKGRRGGLRIIYFYFESEQQIWLMTLYGKDEASDLTTRERKALRSAMELELKSRAAKRTARGGRPGRIQ